MFFFQTKKSTAKKTMTSFGTPKILTGEEAEEALTKQRLTVEQSKKMARLLRSEQKKEGKSINQNLNEASVCAMRKTLVWNSKY
jgi:hypothetical protein